MDHKIKSDYKPRNSMIKIVFILLLALAIPITVTVLQQRQDIRQHASESNMMPPDRPQQAAQISGYVYIDANINGRRDPEEKPLPKVEIQITQANAPVRELPRDHPPGIGPTLAENPPIADHVRRDQINTGSRTSEPIQATSGAAIAISGGTTSSESGRVIRVTTDSNGYFTYSSNFTNSGPVFLTAKLILPAGYRSTSPTTLTINPFGEDVVQFGVTNCAPRPACLDSAQSACQPKEPQGGWCPTQNILDGRVFIDTNKNGVQDQGEDYYTQPAGVTLYQNGKVIEETTVNTDGYFIFSGIQDGTYQVILIPQSGYSVENTSERGQSVTLPSDTSVFGKTHAVASFAVVPSETKPGEPTPFPPLGGACPHIIPSCAIGKLLIQIRDDHGCPNYVCVSDQSPTPSPNPIPTSR